MRLSTVIKTDGEPTAQLLADALDAGLAGIVARGKAEVGDKTLVDALSPPLTPLNKLLLTMALPPRRSLRQPKPLTKAAMRLSRWWLVAAERHTLENEARGTRTQEPPRWPCSWRPQHTAYQGPIMSDQGVGIVIVSHSCPLGRAAADLASQMLPGPEIPPIEVAAGLDDTTLGTDATAVSAAIEKVGNCDGILVLVDIGSAILSAEMALDLLDADIASKVKISTAPLVEGL